MGLNSCNQDLFNLPTETRKDRKAATRFRKNLLDDGFGMQIADKQFGMIELFQRQKEAETEQPTQQLELF